MSRDERVVDDRLRQVSPDAARSTPGGAELDPTGLTELMDSMRMVQQIVAAAKLTGFTDAQAFQLGRDYFTTMLRMGTER